MMGDRRPLRAARRRPHDAVPDEVVAQGKTAAEKFLLRWRGEADPKAVKAIDTYWICTAEHGLNASTFTARIAASTGADCGAALFVGGRRALRAAARRRARVRASRCSRRSRRMGDPEKWVQRHARLRQADHGLRPPHLPRRGSALAHPQGDRARARLAADRGRRAARGGGARRARAAPPGPAAEDERRVLLRASSSTSPTSRRRSRPRCSAARASPAGRRTSSSRSAPGGCSGRRRGTSGPPPRTPRRI